MLRCLHILCAITLSLALLSSSEHSARSEVDLLKRAKLNIDQYPEYLRKDLTIANLRKFHSVASVTVTTPDKKIDLTSPNSDSGSRKQYSVDPAAIVQIGKAVWQIIEDNQPSVNATEDWAGAIPDGLNGAWTKLQDWKSYVSKPFKFEFKNFLGMKLTEYEWTFKFDYNGNVNGTGLYVTNLGAATTEVYAYLSEHVDVSCKALTPINSGTTASPVASMDYIITMISHGDFEKTQVGCHVTVTGAGKFTVVTCDQN